MIRVQRGEAQAFETLFERYGPRLFAFLARRCGDATTAEDLLQETWLRVVRARERFDPRRRFSTWLFQIANNLCRDRARRREVESRGHQRVREEIDSEPGRGPAPHLELRLELQRRISELPDRLSEVLVLRYYHDLSEREIAQIAGVPPGTVKSRLHKAVQILREGVKRED
jgi:RNA polymerase sigma-70 factor (ECF subfamily)